jgi:hypothetical protein
MFSAMKHVNPQTLEQCADAIEAATEALNTGYLVRSLREGAYPIGSGGTHSVSGIASIIVNACKRVDAIYKEEQDKALAETRKGKS